MSTEVLANSGLVSAPLRTSAAVAPLLPIAAAVLYPWALRAFHGAAVSGAGLASGVWLAVALALPLGCLALASARFAGIAVSTRRLAFMGLTAPPLFVLVGVLTGLLHSPVKDVWIWSVAWPGLGGVAMFGRSAPVERKARTSPRLRIAHGVAAVLILLFVSFHLFNHLMGLSGPEAHARVMRFGRLVYRSSVMEPVLVALMLFQVMGGVALAWRLSARPLGLVKTIQVGSGAYLAAFVLTHMNSALVAARAVRGMETDWAWASGAPEGLLLDAWNSRLVPHYALGVFFVGTHLFCGLRQVLVAHQVRPAVADRLWAAGLLGAGLLSLAVTAGLGGLRL